MRCKQPVDAQAQLRLLQPANATSHQRVYADAHLAQTSPVSQKIHELHPHCTSRATNYVHGRAYEDLEALARAHTLVGSPYSIQRLEYRTPSARISTRSVCCITSCNRSAGMFGNDSSGSLFHGSISYRVGGFCIAGHTSDGRWSPWISLNCSLRCLSSRSRSVQAQVHARGARTLCQSFEL